VKDTDGQDIPEVYGLGEAGLFDEFFYFLDHLGFAVCRSWPLFSFT